MNVLLPRPLWTRLIERLLFGIALLFLGIGSWAWLDRSAYELVQSWRLDGILGREPMDSSRPSNGGVAAATRRQVEASGLIGRIEIPRLRLRTIVAEGADSLVLHRAVGHLPKTAFPGEPGNVVLAGHRDSFFSDLGEFRSGDRVRITTPDGVFEYRVDSKRVVSPEQTEVLTSTDLPTLTLITCYPFHYLGPVPKRYVIRARQVGRP
jgi:sortase A